jgi:hypothetical protein
VDEMLAAFEGANGFKPHTFVADSIPSWARSGRSKAGKVSRSFRYEVEGCCALVRVPVPGTKWHEQVVQELDRAGYDKWHSFDDESVLRRWLKSRRERVAELRLLKTMGEDASVAELPERKPEQRADDRGRPRAWTSAIHEARTAGIGWSECAVGFSLGEAIELQAGRQTATLQVSALGGLGSASGQWVIVYVSVFNKQDRTAPLPPILARELRRQLRLEHFEKEKLRAPGEARVLDGPIFTSKRMKSAANAADECPRILALLRQRARAVSAA